MNNIFVIGCGNMGSAIISGMLKNGYNHSTITGIDIDMNKLKYLKQNYSINTSDDISILKNGGTIIIAVKPNQIKFLLEKLRNIIQPSKHKILSIAAGIKIKKIENIIGTGFPIARCMPNIAAMVGNSTTAICFNDKVSDEEKSQFLKIINSIGKTFELDEKLFDAVTGLSGSGPAYIFLMIEALADAGVLMGLPRDKSFKLALNTVSGSAEYLAKMEMHPAMAKDLVTSPGGTTIEGLLTLEEGAFKGLIMNAVKRASEKSKILGEKE